MGNEEKLLYLITNALEEALEVSSEQITCMDMSNHSFDIGASVELDFDGPCFMQDYYKGERVSLSVEAMEEKIILRIFVGNGCKNPKLADEFIDKFLETSRYAGVWRVPQSSEENCSLMFETRFKIANTSEFSQELVDRLSLFANDRFTNDIRPFIHYFEE